MSRPKLSEHEVLRDGERDAAPVPRTEAKPEWRGMAAETAVITRPRNVGGRLMV